MTFPPALRLATLSIASILTASGKAIPPNAEALAGIQPGGTATASWWGFDPVDSTRSLQAALNSPVGKLIIDDVGSPWIVTPLILPGDKEIIFQEGVVIEAKQGGFLGKSDCLFTAKGRRNLTLRGKGASFRMRKAEYHEPPYELAEWRHALSLRGCDTVTVEGLTLKDSGGDGIYLGIGPNGTTNRNITIRNVTCDGNNRQGVSVITAENLLFEDCIFRNTGGTAPQAGIDFEPNDPAERLVNCVLRNCRSENNAGHAYHFYLGNLDQSSPPVSIRLENCSSSGNQRQSLYLGIGNRKALRSVRGSIECTGCRFDGDLGGGVTIRGNEADGCRIALRDCEINRRDDPGTKPAPITIESPRQPDLDTGNIEIVNCTIRDRFPRRPIDLVASPLTSLRKLTGSLRHESPAGTACFTLDQAQLTRWFPDHRMTMRIPRYEFDWSRARLFTASPPGSPDLPEFRLRRSATLLGWGEAGVPWELTARVEPVGNHEAPPGRMSLTTADGERRELKPTTRDKQLVYTFTPATTEPVRLQWEGGPRDTITPLRCSARLALSAGARGLQPVPRHGDPPLRVPRRQQPMRDPRHRRRHRRNREGHDPRRIRCDGRSAGQHRPASCLHPRAR